MKRSLMSLIGAILILSSPVSAQKVFYGIKTGVNFSKLMGPDVRNNDVRICFAGGGYINFKLWCLTAQPELLYSQKGAKEEGDIMVLDYYGNPTVGGHYVNISKYDYIEVPILFKYSFRKNAIPSIYIGPSIGMLINAKQESTIGGVTTTTNVKDKINESEIGLLWGAEIKTPFKVAIDIRYSMSLSTIYKSVIVLGNTTTPEIKNSTVSVMLSYKI